MEYLWPKSGVFLPVLFLTCVFHLLHAFREIGSIKDKSVANDFEKSLKLYLEGISSNIDNLKKSLRDQSDFIKIKTRQNVRQLEQTGGGNNNNIHISNNVRNITSINRINLYSTTNVNSDPVLSVQKQKKHVTYSSRKLIINTNGLNKKSKQVASQSEIEQNAKYKWGKNSNFYGFVNRKNGQQRHTKHVMNKIPDTTGSNTKKPTSVVTSSNKNNIHNMTTPIPIYFSVSPSMITKSERKVKHGNNKIISKTFVTLKGTEASVGIENEQSKTKGKTKPGNFVDQTVTTSDTTLLKPVTATVHTTLAPVTGFETEEKILKSIIKNADHTSDIQSHIKPTLNYNIKSLNKTKNSSIKTVLGKYLKRLLADQSNTSFQKLKHRPPKFPVKSRFPNRSSTPIATKTQRKVNKNKQSLPETSSLKSKTRNRSEPTGNLDTDFDYSSEESGEYEYYDSNDSEQSSEQESGESGIKGLLFLSKLKQATKYKMFSSEEERNLGMYKLKAASKHAKSISSFELDLQSESEYEFSYENSDENHDFGSFDDQSDSWDVFSEEYDYDSDSTDLYDFDHSQEEDSSEFLYSNEREGFKTHYLSSNLRSTFTPRRFLPSTIHFQYRGDNRYKNKKGRSKVKQINVDHDYYDFEDYEDYGDYAVDTDDINYVFDTYYI